MGTCWSQEPSLAQIAGLCNLGKHPFHTLYLQLHLLRKTIIVPILIAVRHQNQSNVHQTMSSQIQWNALINSTAWINFRNTEPSERSQTQRYTWWLAPFTWHTQIGKAVGRLSRDRTESWGGDREGTHCRQRTESSVSVVEVFWPWAMVALAPPSN